MPLNSTTSYYRLHADDLGARYERAEVGDLQRLLRRVFPGSQRLLELGCGSGREASFMLGLGHDVTATDGTREMLDVARKHHPELTGRLQQLALPAQFGFPPEHFDGVYAIAVLMHLMPDQISACLTEIRRILKPGGVFFFSVSTERAGLDDQGRDAQGRYFCPLSAEGWVDRCSQAGFEPVLRDTNQDGLQRETVSWFSCAVRKPTHHTMPRDLNDKVTRALSHLGYQPRGDSLRGKRFHSPLTDSLVMIDYRIHDADHPFSYTEYTTEQNALMHKHRSLYRFALDRDADVAPMIEQLNRYLNGEFEEGKIETRGTPRDVMAIDPTQPEAIFEQAFIDTYGREALNLISREVPMLDIMGHTRWIDYVIHTRDGLIAIEKNGETYHHPIVIGAKRYRDQLLKQNSMMACGHKVFRWSMEGMRFKDRFSEEMHRFFGSGHNFISGHHVAVSRSFELYEHQENFLDQIASDRAAGKNSFLVVLPTGTGKTEILVADLARETLADPEPFHALIMVPQVALKTQMIDELTHRLPQYQVPVTADMVGESPQYRIMVQTYAWMSRHYREFASDHFSHITVDEAHHAVAPTVRKTIHHFNPRSLMGLTATDQRLDARKLEDVFGHYDTQLTLTEAIQQKILSPINAFRLKSNIDLSEVRYNGRDYFAQDLQKTVVVESRDQLIVDTLKKYFVDSKLPMKSGLVFCVSVKHAKRLAAMMSEAGLSAAAVHGADRHAAKTIDAYQQGDVQFLTTCSLLNEGWDSPRTSIIVMARPTMSKVLYTQQLGRGTRKMDGKEALYVIDVVDNYGAAGFNNAPWSIHALLGISHYLPWGSVLDHKTQSPAREELILAGLYEHERALEKINIFTFEREYPDHLSVEQMARELFISTGTLKSWMKNGKVTPAVEIPVGHRALHYFAPEQVDQIRQAMNLEVHDESTQVDDFFAFIKEGTYTFSYKMIMMLNMLCLMDRNGECSLESLTRAYIDFYRGRKEKQLAVDRPNCPYSQDGTLDDFNQMQRSILVNPFEKFERKRFIVHCKDLDRIAFSPTLWDHIQAPDQIDGIRAAFFKDLIEYYQDLDGLPNEQELRIQWRVPDIAIEAETTVGEQAEDRDKPRLSLVQEPDESEMFTRYVPLVSLRAAAGAFSDAQDIEHEGWVAVNTTRTLRQGMFVAQIEGHSMEPRIPHRAYGLFQSPVTGTRAGKIVLVQHHRIEDPDHGGRFTVKRYQSEKVTHSDESQLPWEHARIVLKPINPAYDDIVIEDDAENLMVIAEFLEVVSMKEELSTDFTDDTD